MLLSICQAVPSQIWKKGQRNVTERTIRDVCREYNVNPEWLINGNEPIFEDVTRELDIDEEVRQLTKQYSLLNNERPRTY